jgi:UMF1 family MFS transporter
MNNTYEFYIMAIIIGLVQGGIQSLSRSFFSRIIPADKSAEFFGFYNMMGKFAAVLGPLLVGAVAVITTSSRYSMLSLIILFVLGGVILYFVDEQKAIQNVKDMS